MMLDGVSVKALTVKQIMICFSGRAEHKVIFMMLYLTALDSSHEFGTFFA